VIFTASYTQDVILMETEFASCKPEIKLRFFFLSVAVFPKRTAFLPCLYELIIETHVKVWWKSKKLYSTCPLLRVPQHVSFSQTWYWNAKAFFYIFWQFIPGWFRGRRPIKYLVQRKALKKIVLTLRPSLHGLAYPRQPSPWDNFIESLYVKTVSLQAESKWTLHDYS